MRYKLIVALLLISIGVKSQTVWTNVGNGLQQRVVAGKTEYRFTKITPYAPYAATDSLNLKANITGNNATGTWPISITGKSTGLQSAFASLTYDGRFLATTPNSLLGVSDDQINTFTPNAVKTFLSLQNVNNTSDANKPVSTATQNALNLKINTSEKNAANGVATLDESGKVPLSQINDVLLGAVNYKGTYDATANSPALPAAATGNKGYYYIVSVAGTQFGLTLAVGDWIISNGVSYGKVDNNNAVTSVNGKVGAVTLNSTDVGAIQNQTASPQAGSGFNTAGNGFIAQKLSVGTTSTTDILNVGGNIRATSSIFASTFAGNALQNSSSANNANIALNTTGTVITRNVADASPALIASLSNATSTGKIFDAQMQALSKFSIDYRGVVGILGTNLAALQSFRTNAAGTAPEAFTPATTTDISNLSTVYAPISGSANYIQASPAGNQAASIKITGTINSSSITSTGSVSGLTLSATSGIQSNTTINATGAISGGSGSFAGNVSVGTGSTPSRLTVAGGDVEITGTANGLILTAPNGSRWRVTVSNTGVLTTTAL